MAASDSQWVGNRFNKLTSPLRALLERVRDLLPARWLVLLVGVGCIAYSQYMMEQRALLGQPNPLADEWNALHRLEIVNLQNVLSAIPYFVVGILLCAWTALPAAWKESVIDWTSERPAWTRTSWGKHVPRLLIGTGLIVYLLFQLGKHNYMPLYPFLWIIALWLLTYTFWKWDRENGVNTSLDVNGTDLLWAMLLFLGGLALSAYALQDIPPIMVPDEGSFWENAQAIATKKYQPVFFDSGVYTFPIASSIYQGWVLRFFGNSLWSWRFSSVLAGVAAVVPLYLLAREWFGRRTAVSASVIMLANPYFLSFARLGYNNSQALLPVTLAIYFLVLASRKGSVFYLWLAGLTAGLGFYTYSAVWISMVTLILGIVYLRLRKQISWKQSFGALVLILMAWGAAFGPRLAYASSGDSRAGLVYKMFETSFFSVFYGRVYYGDAELFRTMPAIVNDQYPAIFYDPLIYRELLLRGLVRTVVALFDPFLTSEHFLITPLAGVVAPIFFVIGSVLFLRKWKQMRFGLPLIWLISGLIFLSIIGAFPPRHTHMVSLIPVIALIAGAGLSAVVESLAESLPERLASFRGLFVGGVTTVALLVILYFGAQRYFVITPATYPPGYEDYASWVAWSTEKPVRLIYMGATDVAHRVAYLVNAQLVPHTYINSPISSALPMEAFQPDRPTVVFAETIVKQGYPYLEQPPAGFGPLLEYRDRLGNILGYAMANSPDVQLQWQAGYSSGWDSLTRTPVWVLLIILMIGILLVALWELRNRVRLPRLSIERGSRVEEESTSLTSIQGDDFEIEFRLRIRRPSRKRNQP